MTALGRRIVLLGALVVAAAAALGWISGDDAAGPTVAARAPVKFVAVAPRKSDLQRDMAILAQRQPWGVTKQDPAAGQAQAGAGSGQGPGQGQAGKGEEALGQWRIGGIVRLGEQSFVILMIQPQPNAPHFLKYLSVGNTLPDGRTIEGITGDTVLLRQGDRQVVLRLYVPGAG
jgi:hypothetical protein